MRRLLNLAHQPLLSCLEDAHQGSVRHPVVGVRWWLGILGQCAGHELQLLAARQRSWEVDEPGVGREHVGALTAVPLLRLHLCWRRLLLLPWLPCRLRRRLLLLRVAALQAGGGDEQRCVVLGGFVQVHHS
jgi:hypothetical protein